MEIDKKYLTINNVFKFFNLLTKLNNIDTCILKDTINKTKIKTLFVKNEGIYNSPYHSQPQPPTFNFGYNSQPPSQTMTNMRDIGKKKYTKTTKLEHEKSK